MAVNSLGLGSPHGIPAQQGRSEVDSSIGVGSIWLETSMAMALLFAYHASVER